MSESSYEKCHMSHRGYMSNEIDTAREVLRKHKKLCVDSVKELRDKTDMPMSECCDMLRCLWRDAKLECIQAENDKLRELVRWMYDRMDESCAAQYPYAPTPISYDRLMQALARARKLGVEVDDGQQ